MGRYTQVMRSVTHTAKAKTENASKINDYSQGSKNKEIKLGAT